jgi:hypothetical protein
MSAHVRPPSTGARAAALRAVELPCRPRTAAAALAAALAVGVLAGIAGSPAGPALAARRITIAAAPPAAPSAVAGVAAQGDLGAVQAVARPAAAPPAVANVPAASAPAPPPPQPAARRAATPKPKPAVKARPAPGKTAPAAAVAAPPPRPPVKHVTVVALADAGIHEAFGPRTHMPYLARELRAQGVLLRQYHAIAHGNLPNLVGLLSGRSPDPATAAPDAPSLPAQLGQAGLGWRVYLEGGDPPPGEPPAPCLPPGPQPDGTPGAVDRDPVPQLADVAGAADCTAHVGGLGGLLADLPLPATAAAAFSLVIPDACHAGRDGACPAGEPSGLDRADAWLREWMPQILAAPAYADDGLVVITFAEARATGPLADDAEGGSRVGAIVLTPHAKPATLSDVPYGHYALLRTIEDAFALDHAGLAGGPDVRPFGADVFAAP